MYRAMDAAYDGSFVSLGEEIELLLLLHPTNRGATKAETISSKISFFIFLTSPLLVIPL